MWPGSAGSSELMTEMICISQLHFDTFTHYKYLSDFFFTCVSVFYVFASNLVRLGGFFEALNVYPFPVHFIDDFR